MPTYQRADSTVTEIANAVLCKFPDHKPILDARVKIDYLFAYASSETECALTLHGCKALGITRKLGLKDRAKGNGDAEICIDADWWNHALPEEREALLDHELYHIEVDELKRDDLGRPVIRLRQHDFQFGWFAKVAARHEHSLERQQAKEIAEAAGQYFWPGILFETAAIK